ncbi:MULTISPECIES: hypothetical protein [unclassified Streptomyces]|uniref:hypothetical protein n=1 Tax=unclassified Streptomyces TaxID=2593676 RepID=UPI00278BFACF|nr:MULTISPECIES: hypothetical protein [unclassified Streptomyces]
MAGLGIIALTGHAADEREGEPMLDPQTGEGFDAPAPPIAYWGAPELMRESADLLEVSTRLTAEQGSGAPLDAGVEREYLLRRAALADRLAIEFPDEVYLSDAVRLSWELGQFDQRHPHFVAGPHGPMSIEFDPSRRPYVRQEYSAWNE